MDNESSASAQVLFVADSASQLAGFAVNLMQAGYAISTAPNAAQGLAQSAAQPWDAIIIDQTPVAEGIALVAQIHARAPQLPIILLLPSADGRYIEQAFQAGAYDLVFTPLNEPLLRAALDRACERQQLSAAQQSSTQLPGNTLLHDLNNYLSGILGVAQIRLNEPALPQDLREDFQQIADNAYQIRDRLRRP